MANALGGGVTITKQTRQFALTVDNGLCHYCMTDPATTVDHIVPQAFGGTDARFNLVGACLDCNYEKADEIYYCNCERCAAAHNEYPIIRRRNIPKLRHTSNGICRRSRTGQHSLVVGKFADYCSVCSEVLE